jgi:Tfp pilus assembly protein PilN
MSNVLLCVLLVVCVIGALFTTIVAVGIGAMCMKAQDDIRMLDKQIDSIRMELAQVKEFNQAVTDCISGIGNALDVINERTNWLDGLDTQISTAFGQNKDEKES